MASLNRTLTSSVEKNRPLTAPLKVGTMNLQHRVGMSAMTRLRGNPGTWEPQDMVRTYYEQRASKGGFMLSECLAISPTARGYARAPNAYDDAHIAAWKRVVDSVHAKGGYMFMQVFHAGRVTHTSYMPEGQPIQGASTLKMEGTLYTAHGKKEEYPVPHALSTEEVAHAVKDFAQAAKRSVKEAGADGVELHAGNGYLLQEFMALKTNDRTDKYGGSLQNRMRFLLEAIDATAAEVGPERVGVKLQPGCTFSNLIEPVDDVYAQLKYLGPELSKRKLAFVELSSVNDAPYYRFLGLDKPHIDRTEEFKAWRDVYDGVTILNGGLSIEDGVQLVKDGVGDMVTFGVHFIANANLPALVAAGYGTADLNQGGWDNKIWYTKDPSGAGDEQGYIDWPLAAV